MPIAGNRFSTAGTSPPGSKRWSGCRSRLNGVMERGTIADLKTSRPVRLALRILSGALAGFGVGIATYDGNNIFDLFFGREQLTFVTTGALAVIFADLAERTMGRPTKYDLFRP